MLLVVVLALLTGDFFLLFFEGECLGVDVLIFEVDGSSLRVGER